MASTAPIRSLCVSLLAFTVAVSAVPKANFVPGRYLVEYEDDADHSLFTTHLKRDSIAAIPVVTTESEVFKGASYQFDEGHLGDDPLQTLSALPSVKNVWPVEVIKRPTDDLIWKGSDPENAPDSIKTQVASAESGFAPHVVTQVDKLHAANITGRGIKIGIVDDGVDYKHPALGGGFGPGFLVARGYDHVGDEFSLTRGSDPLPDEDPFTECDGHGTHVTGTIAAQVNPFGFLGAAPGVEIGMYRAFSCYGDTSLDIVAAAINKAFADGNDIITASLGKPSGWGEDILAVISERISAKGVICTFAQGNSGSRGPFSAESPASSKDALAIGSVGNLDLGRVFLNASYSTDNGTSEPFGWTFGVPAAWGNVSLPLYVGQYNRSSCDDFSKAGNLTGHIVLIQTDDACADFYKASFAVAKGAERVFMYREGSEATSILQFPSPQDGLTIPLATAVGNVPDSTAQKFIKLLKSGNKVTLHITDPKWATQYIDNAPNAGGGYMSTYSSWGPTFELDVKPDVSTPGGYILSTWPVSLGGYAVISGTSMATPLTAGIFALIMQARGKLSVPELRSLISTTSVPIFIRPSSNATNPIPDLSPVPQQGSGLVQAYAAARTTTFLSTSKLILNDTDHFVQTHNFTLRNSGTKEVTYIITHTPAPTFHTFNSGSNIPAVPANLDLFRHYANVSFASPRITVGAGKETTILLTFTPPTDVVAKRTPIYSGYISIDGSTGDHLSIPYLGVAGRMRDIVLVDDAYISRYDPSVGRRVRAPQGYKYTLPKNENGTWTEPVGNVTVRYEDPIFSAVMAFGFAEMELEVWSVRGIGSGGGNGSAGLVKNWGKLEGYPVEYQARGFEFTEYWNGTLGDGTRAPAGNYTFLVKALKVLGTRGVEGDYERKRSVDFVIEYA